VVDVAGIDEVGTIEVDEVNNVLELNKKTPRVWCDRILDSTANCIKTEESADSIEDTFEGPFSMKLDASLDTSDLQDLEDCERGIFSILDLQMEGTLDVKIKRLIDIEVKQSLALNGGIKGDLTCWAGALAIMESWKKPGSIITIESALNNLDNLASIMNNWENDKRHFHNLYIKNQVLSFEYIQSLGLLGFVPDCINLTPKNCADLMDKYGPLWVIFVAPMANRYLHSVVVYAVEEQDEGDCKVRYLDPTGEDKTTSLKELKENYDIVPAPYSSAKIIHYGPSEKPCFWTYRGKGEGEFKVSSLDVKEPSEAEKARIGQTNMAAMFVRMYEVSMEAAIQVDAAKNPIKTKIKVDKGAAVFDIENFGKYIGEYKEKQ
jgi:hypothetical protein